MGVVELDRRKKNEGGSTTVRSGEEGATVLL